MFVQYYHQLNIYLLMWNYQLITIWNNLLCFEMFGGGNERVWPGRGSNKLHKIIGDEAEEAAGEERVASEKRKIVGQRRRPEFAWTENQRNGFGGGGCSNQWVGGSVHILPDYSHLSWRASSDNQCQLFCSWNHCLLYTPRWGTL